jgi:hypothetical protein
MINLEQESTKRGVVMAIFGMAALIGYFMGRDPQAIIAAGMTLSGLLGATRSD